MNQNMTTEPTKLWNRQYILVLFKYIKCIFFLYGSDNLIKIPGEHRNLNCNSRRDRRTVFNYISLLQTI